MKENKLTIAMIIKAKYIIFWYEYFRYKKDKYYFCAQRVVQESSDHNQDLMNINIKYIDLRLQRLKMIKASYLLQTMMRLFPQKWI